MPFITLSNLTHFFKNLLSKNLVFKKALIIAPNMYDDPGGVTQIGSFLPMPSSPNLQIPQLTIQSYDRDKGNLGGVFYRGNEVATERYVNNAVENETNRWKKAYNALRKRSYPTAFDPDELTFLTEASPDSGHVVLPSPYTNFDGLLIYVTSHDTDCLETIYISSKEISNKKNTAESKSFNSFFLFSHYMYLACALEGFATTEFNIADTNCGYLYIYGVRFKEITLT